MNRIAFIFVCQLCIFGIPNLIVCQAGEPTNAKVTTKDLPSDDADSKDTSVTEEAESDAESDAESTDDTLAGHSKHGEVFNDGPRQEAYLMPGTGKIKFEVTSDVEAVQPFIEQGIGQLHGFWYFEAERTFRHAAKLDPDCAIAYWGMAMANVNNDDRAEGFAKKALELSENASDREKLYIEGLHEFRTSKKKRKEKEAAFVESFAKIANEFPDDLEAKAFHGYALYKYRGSTDKTHAEVDVVLDSVLAKEKQHPVHHYRIHLWDHKSPQRALDSAAKCGSSANAIAHMWHMCGHIFSRVKRFDDASWFQEASARVDHRHMMHDNVLPDQIHNFAHNNEWLIRNLMNVGRVSDALDLAKNMIELPRHPKYNMLDERNSTSYGRDRLMDVLNRYELWEQAIALAGSPYLEPTDEHDEQLKRLRLLGEAYARTDHVELAEEVVAELNDKLEAAEGEEPTKQDARDAITEKDPEEKQEEDAKEDSDDSEDKESEKKAKKKKKDRIEKEFKKLKDKHKRKVERIEKDIALVKGYIAIAGDDLKEGLKQLEKADADKLSLAQVRVRTGDEEKAVKDAKKHAKDRERQVQPLAGLVEVAWSADDKDTAREAFVKLRAISNRIEFASPVFDRLEPIAKELGYGSDWRVELPEPTDLGDRPDLDTLGPFRWQPAPAPSWLLPNGDGELQSLRDYQDGKPVVVVFYLGFGCLHCAEQLQALAPRTKEFEKAGIKLIAISTDNIAGLAKSHANYEEEFPFPLLADPSLDVFKAYRAHDDFEDVPLHGTYLIDGRGRVRWQDISYEPFMDIDFLLEESTRLLGQDAVRARGIQLAGGENK